MKQFVTIFKVHGLLVALSQLRKQFATVFKVHQILHSSWVLVQKNSKFNSNFNETTFVAQQDVVVGDIF